MSSTEDKEKITAQLTMLTQALSQLEETLNLEPTRVHKDATIQRFEFCFELAWKLLQSLVRFNGIEVFGPRNSIRSAGQLELIDDPIVWMKSLEARNLTTHVYSGDVADEVYKQAEVFFASAQQLATKTQELLTQKESDKHTDTTPEETR